MTTPKLVDLDALEALHREQCHNSHRPNRFIDGTWVCNGEDGEFCDGVPRSAEYHAALRNAFPALATELRMRRAEAHDFAWALAEIMDGIKDHDIQAETGASDEVCAKIATLRRAALAALEEGEGNDD
jgi:hypothetical protein